MLVSEFVEKYAGSEWAKSYQIGNATAFREEATVARKMQQSFLVNYGVRFIRNACFGYYKYTENTNTFQGLFLATKKEVAFFTLFLVRYCFPPQTTVQLYADFLDKFATEYPDVAEEVKAFKEEVLVKSTSC
jgi:hypothetical protein